MLQLHDHTLYSVLVAAGVVQHPVIFALFADVGLCSGQVGESGTFRGYLRARESRTSEEISLPWSADWVRKVKAVCS